jgi:hypothetical protein
MPLLAGNEKVQAGSASFEQHKEALLAILRKAYERGPKSEPFDAENAWWLLSFLAAAYFCQRVEKPVAIPAADRKKRLLELETALSRARALVDEAMQNDFYVDLLSAWGETNGRYDNAPEITPADIIEEFDKVVAGVAGLSALEAAACRAANNVHTRGRPSGAGLLPPSYILELARIYLQSTQLKPETREPFAGLVREFLSAIGQGGRTSPDYAVEAIKYARKGARKKPNVLAPSPFDD